MSNYKLLQTMSNECNTSEDSVYENVAENDKSNDENDENNEENNDKKSSKSKRAIIVGNMSEYDNYGIDHKGNEVKKYVGNETQIKQEYLKR